jgi:hypothetical protein
MLNDLISRISDNLELGHSKREDAFLRQVQGMCSHPGPTAAGQSCSPADIMSAYRFAGNPNVSLNDLRETRMKTTLSYVQVDETVLLVNDVSQLNYYNHNSKSDRRRIGDGKGKGYEYVCNLAVSLERERTLGVLHDCLISETAPDDLDSGVDYFPASLAGALPGKSIAKLPFNHKHIITVHAAHIAQNAPGIKFISTADREFDDHFHFMEMKKAGIDVVIRSCARRSVQVHPYDWLPKEKMTKKLSGLPNLDGLVYAQMDELAKLVPLTPMKTLYLDKNDRLTKAGPEAQAVPVSVGTFEVVLYRDAKRDRIYVRPEDYVRLNVVVVRETHLREGHDPIFWVLFTSLPVNTMEQISKIVRIYELRWLIECFFKLLKSGFGLEELRFDGAGKVAKHLIVTTIAAAYVSSLKESVGIPASTQLDDTSFDRIKHASKNLNDNSIDIKLRVLAFIAMQGKWLGNRRNGISPLMLMKGIAMFVTIMDAAHSLSEFLREAKSCFP